MKRVRLIRKPTTSTKKAQGFVYVSVEERQHKLELRKRKKLGIRHDPLVPADRSFTRCITEVARATGTLNRYLASVFAEHGQRK